MSIVISMTELDHHHETDHWHYWVLLVLVSEYLRLKS